VSHRLCSDDRSTITCSNNGQRARCSSAQRTRQPEQAAARASRPVRSARQSARAKATATTDFPTSINCVLSPTKETIESYEYTYSRTSNAQWPQLEGSVASKWTTRTTAAQSASQATTNCSTTTGGECPSAKHPASNLPSDKPKSGVEEQWYRRMGVGAYTESIPTIHTWQGIWHNCGHCRKTQV
jgi:hypothetical protein